MSARVFLAFCTPLICSSSYGYLISKTSDRVFLAFRTSLICLSSSYARGFLAAPVCLSSSSTRLPCRLRRTAWTLASFLESLPLAMRCIEPIVAGSRSPSSSLLTAALAPLLRALFSNWARPFIASGCRFANPGRRLPLALYSSLLPWIMYPGSDSSSTWAFRCGASPWFPPFRFLEIVGSFSSGMSRYNCCSWALYSA